MVTSFSGCWPPARRRRRRLHLERGRCVDHVGQIAQFVGVLVERMAGDEEAEHFFFRLQPLVLVPVRHVGQRVRIARCVSTREILKNTRTNRAARLPDPAALSARVPWLCRPRRSAARGRPNESSAPALDQRLEDPFVQQPQIDLFAELIQRLEAASLRLRQRSTRPEDRVDGIAPDILDRRQPEADGCTPCGVKSESENWTSGG